MKILVIDDHDLIRQAMQGVIKKLKRDAVVLAAANYAQAMDVVVNHPDIGLVLLDLTLPDRDGFLVLTDLRGKLPAASVVVLSAVQDPVNVMTALDLGARGYIPKSAPSDVILNALRLVFSGGIYVPPEILAGGKIPHTPQLEKSSAQPSLKELRLTERQLAVLALMMQGKSNKAICRALDVAESTVKTHVTAILQAMHVSSRSEAIVAATKFGWQFGDSPRL